MIDHRLSRVAESFWGRVGDRAPFPRTLDDVLPYVLPLSLTPMPGPRLSDVAEWAKRQGFPFRVCGPDRRLHGCLVAFRGQGWILYDSDDPENERRFTLAHETAHFLLDYLDVRERAVTRLGEGIRDVLDGARPPTNAERIDAVLGRTVIGAHTHLMERRADGAFGCAAISGAESQADLLALELLAPEHEIHRRSPLDRAASSVEENIAHMIDLLSGDFGLPRALAERHGRALCRVRYGGRSARERLGF